MPRIPGGSNTLATFRRKQYWHVRAMVSLAVCTLSLTTAMFSGCSSTVVNAAQQNQQSGAATATNSWVSCDTNAKADAIGINVNNVPYDDLVNANLAAEMQQSGAGWTRFNLYWAWLEWTPGDYHWSKIDAALAALQKAHITPLVTLMGPVPCWA